MLMGSAEMREIEVLSMRGAPKVTALAALPTWQHWPWTGLGFPRVRLIIFCTLRSSLYTCAGHARLGSQAEQGLGVCAHQSF